MDLRKMLGSEKITDYSWFDRETFEPQGKDINKLDEIAFQQGGMDIGPRDDTIDTIETQMNVKNPTKDIETLIYAARILLNQGLEKKSIMKQLSYHFTEDEMKKASKKLNKLFKDEGVVGFIAIDLRSTKKHDKLIKSAKKSPYRKFYKAVLMNPEQLEEDMYVVKQKVWSSNMKKGSIDGLLGDVIEEKHEYYYAPLNLPIITSSENINKDWIDLTIKEILAYNNFDEKEISKDVKGIKKAFVLLNRKRKEENSNNKSKKAEDKSNQYKMKLAEIILDSEEKYEDDLQIDSSEMKSAEINIDIDKNEELDVDPYGFVDSSFEGIDEIILEDEKPVDKNLEVNHRSSMDW